MAVGRARSPDEAPAAQSGVPRETNDPAESDVPRETLRAAGTDLQGRLKQLAPNHPSSSARDDASHKPASPDWTGDESATDTIRDTVSAPRVQTDQGDGPDGHASAPRDLRPVVEPLTDAEYAELVEQVRDRLSWARAEGLATDDQHTVEPDKEVWTERRTALHDAILRDLLDSAADVPNEYQAIIAGGLSGAGKTTVLARYAADDSTQYFKIDPDSIKAEMARRGMIPKIEGLTPMEASDLAHEESSHIAKILAQRAQASGKNLIWDITMSERSSAESRIEKLRAAGYTRIEGVFVDIPLDTGEARASARHRHGHDQYLAGKGDGGRFVPTEVIRNKADPVWGSVNRKNFEELKHRFDKWAVYDNAVDGREPVLVESGQLREQTHVQ